MHFIFEFLVLSCILVIDVEDPGEVSGLARLDGGQTSVSDQPPSVGQTLHQDEAKLGVSGSGPVTEDGVVAVVQEGDVLLS